MASYAQARQDFEFLETLAELEDQVELDACREALMRDPTKARAARLYTNGVQLWLGKHGAYFGTHPRVREIAERY